MSKDHRFNKKEYEDDGIDSYSTSSKHAGHKKHIPEKKPKASFQRVDKRNLA